VPDSDTTFRARVILLGASNATRGLSTAFETMRLMLGSPLEVIGAIGHGRSYGSRSSVFVRSLPGILESGLWQGLRESVAARPDLPSFALITDIGNDIMYGASPTIIAGWIEECVERLQAQGATVIMTMLPIERIRAVRLWHFIFVKMILFPTRDISFKTAMERANELHDLLVDIGQRRQVTLVDCCREWYGFDPIHIQRGKWPAAWSAILCSCKGGDEALPRARGSLSRWLRLRLLTPQRWWVLGRQFHTPQPAGTMPDGSVISLY
jgi:hypothetical protein